MSFESRRLFLKIKKGLYKQGAVQKVRVTDFLEPLIFSLFKKMHKKIVLSSKMKLPYNITERTIFYEQSNDYS
ncbi:hypothetical protein CX649_01595 [Bacillaceae bacterium ZC4]|nr:hypothetical protein CX649_01595 [Bacillaceae bacterium ZC4]